MNDDFDLSISGARAAEETGDLASWVKQFLASDGSDNAELGRMLTDEKAIWRGPVELPLDRLHRLAGPPDQPTLERLDDDDLETVEDMVDSVEDGWEPAPLIVSLDEEDRLVAEDGNHRIEALRRAGHSSYWVIVGLADETQLETFESIRGD